ncbi:TPA: hypothetical protein N0F65_011171 [Lagenidium giganteum]|uniref:NADAR domain-containing protein n=1 Tax=Lagenidium giganteum TaxID=4803 RepID=A0AAV2Z9B0_9STRA|nr:TPA: hypothetical protein N0F65_011171 [Lagenidium giganteum]
METHTAVYFYQARHDEFGCFSNFYPCKFADDQGRLFHSSEHYFMKRKQELFDPNNEELAQAIMTAKTPAAVKKLGRQVRNYDDAVWSDVRLSVMVDGLKLKFGTNAKLMETLLATKDKRLYEAAPRDAIWGIGLGVEDVRLLLRENPEFLRNGDIDEETQARSFGSNLLGKALMETRAWYDSGQGVPKWIC